VSVSSGQKTLHFRFELTCSMLHDPRGVPEGFVGRLPRAEEFRSVEEFSDAVIHALEAQSSGAPVVHSIARLKYSAVRAEVFLSDYAKTGTPVVLTDAAQSMGYDMDLWQPLGLVAKIPDYPIVRRPSGRDYDKMNEDLSDRTLAEYVADAADHSYGANNMLHPALIPSIVLPDLGFPRHCFRLMDTRLWIGKGETGAHLHQDIQDNCLLQLAGCKRVSLQPPHHAAHLDPWGVTPFLRSSRSSGGQSVEVMLSAGDMLYIPSGWWHATQNVAPAGEAAVSLNFFMSGKL